MKDKTQYEQDAGESYTNSEQKECFNSIPKETLIQWIDADTQLTQHQKLEQLVSRIKNSLRGED